MLDYYLEFQRVVLPQNCLVSQINKSGSYLPNWTPGAHDFRTTSAGFMDASYHLLSVMQVSLITDLYVLTS